MKQFQKSLEIRSRILRDPYLHKKKKPQMKCENQNNS